MSLFDTNQESGTPAPAPAVKRKLIQHDAQNEDTRRQIMICYGRAATFLTHYLNAVDLADPPSLEPVKRVIQKLVDLSETQAPVVLSLTTMHGDGDEYLVFHHVNVALMAISMGRELGFSRRQMLDLGIAALFHETGESRLPKEMFDCAGGLSDEAKEALKRIPNQTVLHVLNEKSAGLDRMRRMVMAKEISQDHSLGDRDEKGQLLGLVSSQERSVFSEIICICCVYDALRSNRPYRSAFKPEAAVLFMWSELRHRFDADLLKVFMRVMMISPFKLRGKQAEKIIQKDMEG